MKSRAASGGTCQRDDGGLMGCCQLHLQRAVVFIRQRWGRTEAPSVGSQRQFFQARSHQFLSEGSPSNVLPFCCAVTGVIPQFIALWAGSFYHESFSPSFPAACPSSFFPLSPLLATLPAGPTPLCSALFAAAAAAEALLRDLSVDTTWRAVLRVLTHTHKCACWHSLSDLIMCWNLFLSSPPPAALRSARAVYVRNPYVMNH